MKELHPNEEQLPLAASESLFRAIFERTADAVIVSDPLGPGRVLDVNPAACRMFGYTREEFLQLNRAAMLERADSGLERLLNERAETGQTKATLRYRRKDGSCFEGELSSAFLDSTDNRAAVTIIRDITGRTRIETTLRESEEKYRSLFENLNSAALLIEPMLDGNGKLADFRYLVANASVEKQLGKTPDEMVGRLYSEVWQTEKNPVFDIYEGVLSSGEPFKGELLLPSIGRYFDMAVYRPTPGRLALILSDITGRRRAEEELRELNATLESRVAQRAAETLEALEIAGKERQRLYGVLETLPVYVILLTADYHVPFANYFFRSRFGESEGKRCYEYLFNRTEPCETCETYTVLKTSEPHHWYWTGPDNRDYDIYDYPFVDADGSTMILEMGIDITEQKQAQARIEGMHHAANAERERFLNVLETLPMILTLLRPDHRVEWANKAYRDALGDNVGQLCYVSQFGRGKPCEECQAFMPLETGRLQNWEWKLPDGRTFDIYDFPFSDIDGSPMILEMDIDVTEQRRAEEVKGSLEAQLRQAQKLEALGTLSGGIAHDFNNILAAIIGFSEIAADRTAADPKARKAVQRVFEAGIRGRELVKQMLTFSRKTDHEMKPLLLTGVVKEVMKLLRASIPTTIGIKVNVRSESGYILGDPVQIQQVLMNLCTNAAFAMREKGGVLSVELSDFSVNGEGKVLGLKSGLYMRLVVSDTGIGIAPEHIERIFDPFFTTKKLGEGTGLGLSVVHGIVNQHGGLIKAESEPGKGSTFTVYLPKAHEARSLEATPDESLATGDERVLFVDDEEALVEMGEELLTRLGYHVTSRTSSREALALFRLDPSQFDLVLTDQTMPDITGVELAREVMIIRADIPVVLSTGFSHLVDADTAKAAGIKAFAMKPLTKKEIARTVRKVLDENKKRG
jgi:PAS domain S-box-containing protein